MTRHINTVAMLFSALIVGAGSIGSAHAQDCPRGDLDTAYCDRDGDLVADAPTDPKQLVNPSTLIFAYTPVEDPAVYAKVWDGFVEYMAADDRKKGRVLPGAVERRRDRGDALRPAACRRTSTPAPIRSRSIARASCRLPSWARKRAISATKWKSSCRPTARSRRRPTSRARRWHSPSRRRTPATRHRWRS